MTAHYGLIFDVDGVIADSEAVNAEATIRVFEELLGIPGVQRVDFEAGLGRGAEEYIRAAARAHGVELTDDQVAAGTIARQDKFIAILETSPLPPFPGVMPLVKQGLENNEFTVGIATSSTREKSGAILESAQIPIERMVYVTGSDVTHKKPHPELFLTACRRLEQPPSACLVIEDAPNGVEAAHAAGCKCIAVTNSVDADKLTDADLVVDSLEEVTLQVVEALLHHDITPPNP